MFSKKKKFEVNSSSDLVGGSTLTMESYLSGNSSSASIQDPDPSKDPSSSANGHKSNGKGENLMQLILYSCFYAKMRCTLEKRGRRVIFPHNKIFTRKLDFWLCRRVFFSCSF